MFEAAALRVVLEAGGEIPGCVGAALGPTGPRRPDRLGAIAEREWQPFAVVVVAPSLYLPGRGRGGRQKHAPEHKGEDDRLHGCPFRAKSIAPSRRNASAENDRRSELPHPGTHRYCDKTFFVAHDLSENGFRFSETMRDRA